MDMDMDAVISGTMPQMKIDGVLTEWTKTPTGDYAGFIKCDAGDIYIAVSIHCTDQAKVPTAQKGTRVHFAPMKDPKATAHYWGWARAIEIR